MNCPSCGAALAEDQRYCLNCGRRQGEPRVEFRRRLDAKAGDATAARPGAGGAGARDASPAAPAAAPQPATPPPERPQRDYAPLAAAGGIAVLGVMLLIGVLIGRGTGSEESTAAPQVITVGAAESPAGGDGGSQEGGGAGGGGESKGSKKKPAKKRNAAAGGSPGTGNAPVASDETLEALQEKSGADYAKESAKLPDEIATPGAPPPVDKKAPGGGSGGTTIE